MSKSDCDTDVVDRLMQNGQKVANKKEVLKDKYKDNECTFTPNINPDSKLRNGYKNRPTELMGQPLKKKQIQVID